MVKKRECQQKQKPEATEDANSIIIESDEQTKDASANSSGLPRGFRDPKDYLKIPEVPVLEVTEEEFSRPFEFIKQLYARGFEKFGAVKIKPPASWKPEFEFSKISHKVTTRIQVINDMTKGKPYEQKYDEYTYSEFRKFSQDFSKSYKHQVEGCSFADNLRKNEYEFWSAIECPDWFDEIEVEYASDLPVMKFGSAFSTREGAAGAKHPMNLMNVNHQQNSLFQFLENSKAISGITTPWVYLGMLFSCFCWHVEDLYMYALNYLHIGEPKTWYIIPGDAQEKFEAVFRAKYAEVFTKDPEALYHLNTMLSPVEVLRNHVPIYRTDQKPGEFIITFPKAYHAGFSHGFNCGEAVNIVDIEWLKFYKPAIQEYAKNGFQKKPSFSIQWLVIKTIQNIRQNKFDAETLRRIKEYYAEIMKNEKDARARLHQVYGSSLKCVEFSNKEGKYDRFVCSICTNYSFLSYLSCENCRKSGCSEHISICICDKSKMTLFERYTNEELQGFMSILDDEIKRA